MKVGDKVVPINPEYNYTSNNARVNKAIEIASFYVDVHFLSKEYKNWYFPVRDFCLESEAEQIRAKIKEIKEIIKVGDYVEYNKDIYNVKYVRDTYISLVNERTYVAINCNYNEISRILTKKEVNVYKLELKEYFKNLSTSVEKEINRISPKRQSILTRELIYIRPKVITDDIFIEHKVKNRDNRNAGYFSVCCAHTKSTDDLYVYIPDISLKLLGYNKLDLIIWLKFLEEAGIDFNYEYQGLVDCPDKMFDDVNFAKKNSQYYSKRKNHLVLIKGANVRNETYFRFILLRYLFEHNYYIIPAAAIQLKRKLKSKITHLEAICMAHYTCNYSSGHALACQPNPFIPFNKVKSRFSTMGMNVNFSTSYRLVGTTTTIQLFENKEFTKILEYFNKLYERTSK